MRKFDLSLELDLQVTVPDSFVKMQREAAQAEDATPFLKAVQEQHPEDDDEFALAILKNGLRRHTRWHVHELFFQSGIGVKGPGARVSSQHIEDVPQADEVSNGDQAVLATNL